MIGALTFPTLKDLFGHDKVEEAIERIKMFEPPEGYYLADSGGKDSSVVLALTKMSGVNFDAHYSVTTIDPPELVRFIRKYHPETKFEYPSIPFFKRLVEKGFPMRVHRWCCAEYKETGGTGRRVMTGIRKQESLKRSGRKLVEQCLKDKSKTYVNPIIDWSTSDIWIFIRHSKTPYCPLYDEGFKRLGCVLCPMSSNRRIQAARWPKMTKAWFRAFEKYYEKNKHLPSNQRWKSVNELFNWWLSDERYRINPDQTVMFE